MEKRENFEIPEEIAEWIGLKKSEYLSRLINLLLPDDIGFEKFHEFDHLIPDTINQSDKAFESEDDDYTIRAYVRTYPGKDSVHQIVLGMMYDDGGTSFVFIPILVFVTKFDELVREFSQGQMISGPILN